MPQHKIRILIASLSILFITAPSLLAKKTKPDSRISGLVFSEDFRNWRDNSTDPGFNTRVKTRGKKIIIKTLDTEYGKAMSKREPITIDITQKTEVVVNISRIAPGAVAMVSLMNAYEPYDAYPIVSNRKKPGIYKANINEATGWQGLTSLWVVVWVQGQNKRITIRDISFHDANVMIKQRKAAALKTFMSRDFAPVPEDSIFYEDFRNGLGNWRTAETDFSFYSELNFEEGVPRIKLVPGKGYCKVMSDVAGIEADITPTTKFEIVLGDMGTSRLKVELMTAHAPFDFHQVIPWVKKPGVYTANISEATEWSGERKFWIQIWMESTRDAAGEKGAVIKYIRISED